MDVVLVSFDLLLYRDSQQEPLNLDSVEKEFLRVPNISIGNLESGRKQYFYQNPNTGVYCSFDWRDEGEEDLSISGPILSFNLNYLRPTFFALETIPLLTQIAHNLRLTVYDLQSEKETAGSEVITEELINSWSTNNSMAINAFKAQAAQRNENVCLVYCSREKLDYFWRYMSAKETIEATLSCEDIFIPQIMLLREKGESKAYLVVVWPEYIVTIFPEVDRIAVGRKKGGFLGLNTKKVMGLAPFQTIKNILASDLVAQVDPVNHYTYRQQPPRAEVKSAVDALNLLSMLEMEAVPVDILVDVELD